MGNDKLIHFMTLLVMVTQMAATKVCWLRDESVLIETWLKLYRTTTERNQNILTRLTRRGSEIKVRFISRLVAFCSADILHGSNNVCNSNLYRPAALPGGVSSWNL